jgi:hypothetical protein
MTTHLNGGRASLRVPTSALSTTPTVRAKAAKRETIRVHLRNVDQYVTLYRDDYDRVVAEIGTARWFLNSFMQRSGNLSRYVRARSPKTGRLVMIARIVAQAPNLTAVRYLDHNPLNLVAGNLDPDTVGGSGGVKKRPKGTVNVLEAREARLRTMDGFAAFHLSKRLGIPTGN